MKKNNNSFLSKIILSIQNCINYSPSKKVALDFESLLSEDSRKWVKIASTSEGNPGFTKNRYINSVEVLNEDDDRLTGSEWSPPHKFSPPSKSPDEEKLYSDLSCIFQMLVFLKAPESVVTEVFQSILKIFNFDISEKLDYRREYDPLSQYFQGDYIGGLSVRFLRELVISYVDYFFYIEEYQLFHSKLIEHRFVIPNQNLFRYCVILSEGLDVSPNGKLVAAFMCNRIESEKITGREIKSSGEFPLSINVKSYFENNDIDLCSSSIHMVSERVIAEIEKEDPHFFKNAIREKNWKILKSYSDQSNAGHLGGIFNYRCWIPELAQLPDDHRFGNKENRIPVIKRYTKGLGWSARLEEAIRDFSKQINYKKHVENFARREQDIPLVGEGKWVSEIVLLKKVRKLTDLRVIHQWSPDWLGNQRFDIGIPELSIAIEYNGRQHYEPIDFFGGEESFKNNLKRDQRKRKLASENGVKLIEIRYDANEKEIDTILSKLFRKAI